MIYDLVYGKIASVIHVAFFAYYFVWIAITPFIDTTHFSQRIFPPREYGLLIPAVILLLIVTIAFSTVSYHLVMKTGHKEKELLMAQRAAAKAAVSKGMSTETRDSGASAQVNPSPSTDFASRMSTPSMSRDEPMLHSPSSTARLAAVGGGGGGRGHYRGGSHGSNGFGSSTTSGVALKPPPSSLSRAGAVRRPVSGDSDRNTMNQALPSSSNLHGGSRDRFVLSRSAAAAALHSSNQRVGNAWAASHPQPNESACVASANESTSTTGDANTSKENLFSVVRTVE